jgi:hypothetical protein
MAINLAPFGRWTLRDKAAQRRLALHSQKKNPMNPRRLIFSFSISMAFLFPCRSDGAIMVSNLDENVALFFSVGANDDWAGSRFITDGSSPSFTLQSITVGLANAEGGGGFFVALFSDAGGLPGIALEPLTGSDDPLSEGDYEYTSSGISLAPNSSYWVVAGIQETGGTFNWKAAGSQFNFTGPWTIPSTNTHITSFPAGGSTWNTSFNNDGFPFLFSVSAVAVPEPSTAVLLLRTMSIMMIVLRHRLRQKITRTKRSEWLPVSRLLRAPLRYAGRSRATGRCR